MFSSQYVLKKVKAKRRGSFSDSRKSKQVEGLVGSFIKLCNLG